MNAAPSRESARLDESYRRRWYRFVRCYCRFSGSSLVRDQAIPGPPHGMQAAQAAPGRVEFASLFTECFPRWYFSPAAREMPLTEMS